MSGPKFQIPVTFDAASRKRDKSVSPLFTTNRELPTDEFVVLDRLIQHSGWLVYSDNEIQPADIPDVPADEALRKLTPSQEMRWLLKKLWEQNHEAMEWPDYYRNRMTTMNNMLKQRLDGWRAHVKVA
jgi:hypothetical protein